MPPRSKQKKHLEKARAVIPSDINEESLQCVDEQVQRLSVTPKQMVLSCLLTGTNPTKFRDCANICNIKTCAMSTYYRNQAEIIPTIIDVSNKTIEKARNESFAKESTRVSTDTCWDSARNGKNSTTTGCDVDTGKTIGVEIVSRIGGNRTGDFRKAANMMESEGINRMSKKFKSDPNCNIVGFVHDGDNKSDNIIAANGFDGENERDAGHGFKSLERRFKTMRKKVKADNHLDKDPFYGIQGKTLGFAKHLVENEADPKQREELWKNVPEHLTGNHEKCHHDDTKKKPGRPRKNHIEKRDEDFGVWEAGIEVPAAKEALADFCKKTVGFISHCSPKRSTQANESQNSLIAREADKNINYGPSYPARVAVAVGKKNDPKNFVVDVLTETGAFQELDPDIQHDITSRWEQTAIRSEKRRDSYERERITKARMQCRNHYKSIAQGDYNEDKTNFD